MRLSGGLPAELPVTGAAPAWSPEGIVFRRDDGIYFLPNGGGSPERVTTPNGAAHWRPQLLPDADHILFTVRSDPGRAAIASRKTGEWHVLEELGEAASTRFVPGGYLLFGRGDLILAARFDPKTLRVLDTPVTVATGARLASFMVSDTGSIAYAGAPVATMVWVDRAGNELGALGKPDASGHPNLSPDGRALAVAIGSEILTIDLERGARAKVAVGGGDIVWHPNGHIIAFRSDATGQGDIYLAPADGSQPPKPLLSRANRQDPGSWSPDGHVLAFAELHASTGFDLWTVTETGDTRPLLVTNANETAPRFSPDGRWIAYASDESGRREIYVRPFPAFDRKWTISTDGGAEPIWRRDGKELFYRNRDTVLVVTTDTSAGFKASAPQALFRGDYDQASSTTAHPHFDVTPDGQRFLMVKPEKTASQIVVVLNWLEELKQRVPTR